MAEELPPDPEKPITQAEAARKLVEMMLQFLPDSMPMLSLRAACMLVGLLAAHADNNPDTIERPPPEMGQTWFHAAKNVADMYYTANRKKGAEA
jgi:hypothetical protein